MTPNRSSFPDASLRTTNGHAVSDNKIQITG
jgi:hypothetical protein